jgi:hypothetical protein
VIREIRSQQALERELVQNEQIYFRLTGGLGNQLFGLSEAFNLHKLMKQHVLIDVGSIEHSRNYVPEWLEWSKSQNWFSIIKIHEYISREFELVNLGERNEKLMRGHRLFTGWEFSLRRVELSGLFLRSEFPFIVKVRTTVPVALHYRAGDYAHTDGIGILKHDYYSRALRKLDSSVKVKVFSDDKVAAKFLVTNLGIGHRSEISNQKSAIEVLFGLATAEILIASNSTLSWWSNYFSDAGTKIAPKPFYLQDWNFDSKAKFDETKYLTRFANPKELIFTRVKWFIRSFL